MLLSPDPVAFNGANPDPANFGVYTCADRNSCRFANPTGETAATADPNKDGKTMKKLSNELTVLTESRLPEKVLVQKKGRYLFFELSRAFSPESWELFRTIMRFHKEERLMVESIDPDEKYYSENYQEKGSFVFDIEDDGRDYVEKMHFHPRENNVDSLAYRADVLVWYGNTARWACWGERDLGICVVALNHGYFPVIRESLKETKIPVLNISEALRDVVASEISGEEFNNFCEDMKKNWSDERQDL